MLATRQRDAVDDARGEIPAGGVRDRRAQGRGDHALDDRAGDGDAPDGDQIVNVKLQPDAEHQQDDADFRELLGERVIGDKARRVRTDQNAGQPGSRRWEKGGATG